MPKIPFIGETYPHLSKNVSPQRTLNLYPEIISNPEAKEKYILVNTPGTKSFADLSAASSSRCRGLHYTAKGVLYAVYGDQLIRVNTDGTTDATFTISGTGGSSTIYFADNENYLVFVDRQEMWLLEYATDTLTTQNSLPFTKPVMVKYIASRFVAFGQDSNQYWWSAVGPDAPLTWEGTGFASAEGSADNITAIGVTDGELILFGPRSYEVHRPTPDNDAPFARVNGSFTNIGCGAPNSVAEIMSSVYWLGSSTAGKNQVFMLQGYNAVPISNPAISNLLGELDISAPNDLVNTTSDCVGFTYQQEGHIFYVMNFLQANKTLVYDTIGQWHERSTRDPVFNKENRWEPLYCVYAYDRVLTGNGVVPQILELDLDTYNEYDGRAIKRQRIGPVLWDDLYEVFHKSLIIDMETGVGLVDSADQGYDPQAVLRWSDDSGHTWSFERTATIGKIGKFGTRLKFNKLGRARNRVYELTITDPVKVVLLGETLDSVRSRKR